MNWRGLATATLLGMACAVPAVLVLLGHRLAGAAVALVLGVLWVLVVLDTFR
jgi:hypothetical protein